MITFYEPLPSYIRVMCSHKDIPYKFRQKMRKIQGMLIDLRELSRKQYTLYIDEDNALLVDTLYNKILWCTNYSCSMAVLIVRLTELVRFWSYETHVIEIDTQVEYNDYLTLKKKYYVRKN